MATHEKLPKKSKTVRRAMEMAKNFWFDRFHRETDAVRRYWTIEQVREWLFSPQARIQVLVKTDGNQEQAEWTLIDCKRQPSFISFNAPTPARIRFIDDEERELRKIAKKPRRPRPDKLPGQGGPL